VITHTIGVLIGSVTSTCLTVLLMTKKSERCTLLCMVLHDHNRVQDSALQNIIVVFAKVADVSVYLVAVHHALVLCINFYIVM